MPEHEPPEDALPSKPSLAENPLLVAIFRLAVPGLLGAVLAYLSAINSAQRDQGNQLADIKGTLKVFTQINTDVGMRLTKTETSGEENAKALAAVNARVLVLESRHGN